MCLLISLFASQNAAISGENVQFQCIVLLNIIKRQAFLTLLNYVQWTFLCTKANVSSGIAVLPLTTLFKFSYSGFVDPIFLWFTIHIVTSRLIGCKKKGHDIPKYIKIDSSTTHFHTQKQDLIKTQYMAGPCLFKGGKHCQLPTGVVKYNTYNTM